MHTTPTRGPVMRLARAFALVAVFALTVLTGVVGVQSALNTFPTATAAPNIDPATVGSITIHKRASATSGPGHDSGNPNPAAPGTGLPGVEYRLDRLQADLTTNAGYQAARALTPTSPLDGTFTAQTGTTDAAGEHTFAGLPVGVYLVTETSVPTGYTPIAPFLVFVPMTNPDNRTDWNYNVHVYPKNAPSAAEKSITDADKNAGDIVTFTITSDVPTPSTAGLSKHVVTDDLDEARVRTATDGSQVAVTLSNGTALVAATDFTTAVTDPGQVVTVTLTPAGLAKVTAARQGDATIRMVTTISATVQPLGAGTSGALTNRATIVSNNGSGAGDTTVATDAVSAYWGKLTVTKDSKDGTKLAGAVFDLYRCTGDADNPTLSGDKLTVNGANNWTTAADGTVTIDGLHVTDFANGAEVTPVTTYYCLVETTAPTGYELLPKPVRVEFTRAHLDANATAHATVVNVETTTPNLPLTGGKGIAAIVVVGLVIIGGGIWYARRSSTRA